MVNKVKKVLKKEKERELTLELLVSLEIVWPVVALTDSYILQFIVKLDIC